MSFLDQIFQTLQTCSDPVLTELRELGQVPVTGPGLLARVAQAREFLARCGLKKGDRVALLAANGIEWIAMDLAVMAEGLVAVPLYSRQAASELVTMMKDCSPSLICCGNASLCDEVVRNWQDAPAQVLLEEIFTTAKAADFQLPQNLTNSDLVAIIYTSGTSDEAKGVMINAGNVDHILRCTSERLDVLMGAEAGTKRIRSDRVYQWAPLNFAAAWITTLTGLLRGSSTFMNTDLSRIAVELRTVEPDYFVNVPALLERVRRAVDEQLGKTGGIVRTTYLRAKAGFMRKYEGKSTLGDAIWLMLANRLVFPAIRKKMVGLNLKALICGSAPLNVETQLFFMMMGIPVLQVYGLTETTAICTMDDPRDFEPGRVGKAVPGVQIESGENEEIMVRGPNVFTGYWNRPEETAKVLRDGWFYSGDQGEVSAKGNWKIVGRIKNLIILNSGHNIAPEPIEDEILNHLSDVQQVVLVGNGRSYLSAIVTGNIKDEQVQRALDEVNAGLPHYKQVRAFKIWPDALTIESGLLTANGKLKRDAIAQRLSAEIEGMYAAKKAM